jgi:hypothetical protein
VTPAAPGNALLQNFKAKAMQLNNSLLQSIDARLSGLCPNKWDRSNNLWENLQNDDNDSDFESDDNGMDDKDYAIQKDTAEKQKRWAKMTKQELAGEILEEHVNIYLRPTGRREPKS